MSDYERDSFEITYRIDDNPAQQTRWTGLISNKGAGLSGWKAERFIRQIYDANRLFIRLVERNGQQHDATFDLSGGHDAYEDVASSCGWTTLSLTSDDYRAIQTMLNAGGFNTGTADGQWGPGSQRAMKKYQASVGLPETGAPDRATLGKLGFLFPAGPAAQQTSSSEEIAGRHEPSPNADTTDAPPWADPRSPGIDYSTSVFEWAHKDGHKISGWWSIKTERSAVDDSPLVLAPNYSQYNSSSGLAFLVARCCEGETGLFFKQDDFLMSVDGRNGFDITYRIDDNPAQQTRWDGITSNNGAGLFGREAERFIRQIYDANRLFIRLVERNDQRHDVTFDLSGGHDAYEDVASSCGWTTLSLTSDDYRAIQTMLNAGGFNTGMANGQWGPGSQRAMKKYQASVGLPETGAPDRATLGKLGFEG